MGGLLAAILLLLVGIWLGWRWFAGMEAQVVAAWIGGHAGVEIDVDAIRFEDGYKSLIVRDLAVGDFARVEFLEVKWTWDGLWRREIESVRALGMDLWLGRMQAATEDRSGGGASPFGPITVKKLLIGQSTLHIDNLAPGLPPIPVDVGAVTAMVLENLVLGAASDDPAASETMIFVIEDLELRSPYDQLEPVLAFEAIRLGFSWNGIQSRQIDQLVFERPTIYIGQDIFWFVDEIRKREAVEDTGEPWTIGNLEIIAGNLVLSSLENRLRLPIIFQTSRTGLVLSDFSQMPLDINLEIPVTNLDYAEYGLRVEEMKGELLFSLPIEERGTKDLSNINPVVTIKGVEFKGLEARDIFITATFDREGVYGRVGGTAYQGYLEGEFTLLLDGQMSWNSWGSISGLDLEPLTDILSPENFVMDGPVNAYFNAKGASKELLDLTGHLAIDQPGTMHVTAIDELIEKLPADMVGLRRDLSKIGLEAFRHYEFTDGRIEFAFQPPLSHIHLNLGGVQGRRDIELRWHDLREVPGLHW